MNQEDRAEFQYAMQLTQSGKKNEAYHRLKALAQKNANNYDADLLLWLAFTTPYLDEARQTLDSVATIAPLHPGFPAAQAHYAKNQAQQQYAQPQVQIYGQSYQPQQYYTQTQMQFGPVLYCPYCHNQSPARVEKKISTGGWVVFIMLLFVFFPLCWIGLLIKEDYFICSRCGIKLGA